MKTIKPLLLILFAAILIFTFCSCGTRKKTESKTESEITTKNDIQKNTNNDIKLEQKEEVKTTNTETTSESVAVLQTNTTKFNTVFDKDGKPHAIPAESTTITKTNFNNQTVKNSLTDKKNSAELEDKSHINETDKSKSKNNNESELKTQEPKPPSVSIKNKIYEAIVLIITISVAGFFFYLFLFKK